MLDTGWISPPGQVGESLRLAPRHLQPRVRGWLLAASQGNTGLVPANHIQILGRSQPGTVQQGTIQPGTIQTGTIQPDILQQANRSRAVSSLEEEWGHHT